MKRGLSILYYVPGASRLRPPGDLVLDPEAPDEDDGAAEVDAKDEEGRGCWNCFCLEGEAFGVEAVAPSDDEAKGLEAVVSPLTSSSSATDRKALRESWATFTCNNI